MPTTAATDSATGRLSPVSNQVLDSGAGQRMDGRGRLGADWVTDGYGAHECCIAGNVDGGPTGDLEVRDAIAQRRNIDSVVGHEALVANDCVCSINKRMRPVAGCRLELRARNKLDVVAPGTLDNSRREWMFAADSTAAAIDRI